MIKFGIRRNLLYPGLFILFSCMRRIDKYFLGKYFLGKIKPTYTVISILSISSFIISLIFLIYYKKKNKNKIEKKETITTKKIKLIGTKLEYQIPDKILKIFILIFFAAYFEFFGFLSRKFFVIYDLNDENFDEFNAKFRGLEILSSSILCYFTLRIQIYKHHIFSLIIVIFCLLTNLVLEYMKKINTFSEYLIKLLFVLISSLSRTFLDTIEKYLFEADYIYVFSLIFIEEFFNLIFNSFFYIFSKPRKQVRDLIHKSKNPIGSIILFVVYGILTAFKNIYRRFTVKQYSPMSRALVESILDPFLLLFEFIDEGGELENEWSFIGTLISTFIIIFCCSVYNEVIILHCFNLEYYTYSEISRRASSTSLKIFSVNDDANDDDNDNDNDGDNASGIELNGVNNNQTKN